MALNKQEAPYPLELLDLVSRVKYNKNYDIELKHVDRGQDSIGLTLCVLVTAVNPYREEDDYKLTTTMFYFPVEPAAYDRQTWQRWLWDQLQLVDLHEAMEAFRIRNDDGNFDTPYAPNHGPGRNPYTIYEYATDEQRRTSFRGDIKETTNE